MPIYRGLIPREGLYAVPLFKLFDKTVLNPSLILPLVLLARYTRKGRALSVLHRKPFDGIKILLYLGLVKTIAQRLSQKARDNWLSDRYNWPREIVVVTGGSSGIGAGIVKLLDEQGITVVVIDIQPIPYEVSTKVHFFQCDIRSASTVNDVAEKIRDQIGHPTVLINNAGVARGKPILDSSPSEVRFTFDINTLSHYWLTRAFLPNMVAQNHGMIVTVASAASWCTTPALVDYCASKAAALAFHEGLTAELVTLYKAPKIRTICVHPGHTKTPLFNGFDQHNDFLFPSLEVETLAEGIVQQVLSGQSGSVTLPATANILPLLRILPDFVSGYARRSAGDTMQTWNGRQVFADVDASYSE